MSAVINRSFTILHLTLTAIVFLYVTSLTWSASLHSQPLYCPNSSSDTDGDGWGWENETSCIILPAAEGTPTCSTAAVDPDADGWGWENDSSCLIDNVLPDLSIDDPIITSEPSAQPLISNYNSDQFYSVRVIDSNGTRYEFSPISNDLVVRDRDNNVVWQTEIEPDNSVNSMLLDNSERYLLVYKAAGQVASYFVSGGLNWETDSFELIRPIGLTDVSIIFQREDWSSNDLCCPPASVVSLGLDGNVNWRFQPVNGVFSATVGNDQNVYITAFGPVADDGTDTDNLYIFEPE